MGDARADAAESRPTRRRTRPVGDYTPRRRSASVDRGAPRALLEPYVHTLKLTFPILLDPDAKTSQRWRVTAIPATFIVRPGGEVAGMVTGAREWNSREMQALVERLLPHGQAHR